MGDESSPEQAEGAAVTGAVIVAAPSLEVLRAKLDAAIVAEAWEAVKAIKARIDEVEREGVVDLARARERRA